jgi:3-dehydroquinate dehydratase/shikimate dehydrogenase
MICISVTPESRQLAKVDILNASRQGDLVELCLDNLIKEPDIKDLLEGAKKPILVSCRNQDEGGHYQGSDDERILLLKQVILAGPAYVELDIDTARKIPRFGKTQRVVSHTSLDRPLGNIESVFDEAVAAKADIIKFTWPTQTLEAAWPLLAAVSQKRSIPVVGLGIGRGGLTFSLLGRKYGSPWIYAALEKGMEAFPGQPTVGDLDDIYRWRQVGPKTRFFGIAGAGAFEQQLSRILNTAFHELNLETRCLPFDVKTLDTLPKMLDILKVPAVIATPDAYKHLFDLSEKSDEVAQVSGHVDLFIKQADGWHGHNLLWKTALRALENKLGRKSSDDRPLDRRNALILGCGGLGKSVAAGVKKRNGLVSIAAGDEDAAQKAAAALDMRYVPATKIYETLVDVVVFTVPNFDHGKKPAPINPSVLRAGMTVLDLNDLPNGSPFTTEAKERGCKVVEPREVFADYVATLFKSLTGQDLPSEAAALAQG